MGSNVFWHLPPWGWLSWRRGIEINYSSQPELSLGLWVLSLSTWQILDPVQLYQRWKSCSWKDVLLFVESLKENTVFSFCLVFFIVHRAFCRIEIFCELHSCRQENFNFYCSVLFFCICFTTANICTGVVLASCHTNMEVLIWTQTLII